MTEIGRNTLNEIEEQPNVIAETIKNTKIYQEIAEEVQNSELIILTGSGSSFNAGFASLYLFNALGQIPTWVVHSSEFPFLIKPILKKEKRHLLISISQSGESLGTVAAAEFAQAKGIPSIAVTVHPTSPLAQKSPMVLPLITGEERSVMATKTYTAQIAALNQLAIMIGQYTNAGNAVLNPILKDLEAVPKIIRDNLSAIKATVKKVSPFYKFVKQAFILGSGPDYATAMEAALKLKEGARIRAEAYSAPEFRHGPIALADEYTMILAIIPPSTSNRLHSITSLLEKVAER
ncbi:MAG: SIS domain-containing protein, partial [Promethearchaeota archaeon]